jgi:uncharacterized membrane protein YkoI
MAGSCLEGRFSTVEYNESKTKGMKIQLTVSSILAAGLLAGCESENQSNLQAEAKISKADAQATALTRAPNGTITEAELEREHGKLIWSFDIATPDSKDTTEVNVDAITGAVVNVEHEKSDKEKGEEAK